MEKNYSREGIQIELPFITEELKYRFDTFKLTVFGYR